MSKKVQVRIIERTCQHCGGTGEVERDTQGMSCPRVYKKKICARCLGKGYYIDKQYYYTDGNICFDSDGLK